MTLVKGAFAKAGERAIARLGAEPTDVDEDVMRFDARTFELIHQLVVNRARRAERKADDTVDSQA